MSKFRPASDFGQANRTYRLLPFRFTALEENRYFLSNIAGGWTVLDRLPLEQLVRHQLSSTSQTYEDLKAKQFLFDGDSDVALDLLGLQLRTKLRPIKDFTGLHIFVVTLRCEHSCPYCQVSRQSDDKTSFDMTEAIARKALDLAFRSPSPHIKIEFQGGEPLLNWPLIKFIVSEALMINQLQRRDLQFVIATNLALITEEHLSFCHQHHIHISTSLDGPSDLHNLNRPRAGRDSYERAVEGILHARQRLGMDAVSALMTTTSGSLNRVEEIIDEYVRLGFDGIFLRPLSPYGFAIKTKAYSKYNGARWLEFYKAGLQYILEINKNGHKFVEQYAATILTKMLTPQNPGYVDLMSPSGIGIGAVVYNYDGRIFASDEGRMLAESGDDTFVIGNVHTSTYEDVFTSPNLLDAIEESYAGSAPMCSDCAFEPHCGSDPVFHHATQGDFVGHKPTSEFCNRNMEIFKVLVKHFSNKDDQAVLRSWVRTV